MFLIIFLELYIDLGAIIIFLILFIIMGFLENF